MFIVQVNKSDVRVLATEPLYAFAKNIYDVHVVFSEHWHGLQRMARFSVGDTFYDIDVSAITDLKIPWELLAMKCSEGKKVNISFIGKWNGHIVIPTPIVSLGVIKPSEIKDLSAYEPPAPPTPNLYEQLKEEIAKKADSAFFDEETRIFTLKSGEETLSEFEIPGSESSSGGNGGDHRTLTHRGAKAQHPIDAIEGLVEELNRIPEPVEAITNFELEEMLV